MRHIQHPGKPSSDPVVAIPCRAPSFDAVLEPGRTLLDAIGQVIQARGLKCGVLRLSGGALESFCYYMPALSQTPDHAVYFSQRYDVAGRVSLESASVTYGQRDGQPWLHCHAVWIEADGARKCGHLIPDVNWVATPIQAAVTVIDQAVFTVTPDSESNFSLFVPIASPAENSAHMPQSIQSTQATAIQSAPQAFAVRLAPNIDVCEALENLCSQLDLDQVEILGGVGSTVGAVFDDGQVVEPFVTEILIRQGQIQRTQHAGYLAQIDVSMVDYTGGLSEGRLRRGENPVLVTFELVLQAK